MVNAASDPLVSPCLPCPGDLRLLQRITVQSNNTHTLSADPLFLKLSVLNKWQVRNVHFPSWTASYSEHTHTPNTGVHRESGQEDAAAFPFTLSPSRSLSSVLCLSILTAANSAPSASNHSLHTHTHTNEATLLKISNQHVHTVSPVWNTCCSHIMYWWIYRIYISGSQLVLFQGRFHLGDAIQCQKVGSFLQFFS